MSGPVRPAADAARRAACGALGLLALSTAASAPTGLVAATTPTPAAGRLTPEQVRRVRAWITVLIHAQLERGPTPRWQQRDCAGLVRFAVAEALREHTAAWKQSMGLAGQRLPAEPGLDAAQVQALRHAWRRADGSVGAYVGALELVQENCRFVSRELAAAEPADLLMFDFGDEQHLMVWMGRYIAYHTGRTTPQDNGLRALRPADLLAWRDTRWRPQPANADFAGVFRLRFLGAGA